MTTSIAHVTEHAEASERAWRSYMVRSEVPFHLHDGLVMYLVHRIRPGSFLTAVLENNLMVALGRADATAARMLPELVGFLREWAPHTCWGSEEQVATWLEGGK
jgi:hypothetical protein